MQRNQTWLLHVESISGLQEALVTEKWAGCSPSLPRTASHSAAQPQPPQTDLEHSIISVDGDAQPQGQRTLHSTCREPLSLSAIKRVEASILATPKWTLLKDWCGWFEKDQFGFLQTRLLDVVGDHGRTMMSGQERPNEYQASGILAGCQRYCLDCRVNSLLIPSVHGYCMGESV